MITRFGTKRGRFEMTREEKKTARDIYKRVRDLHHMNSRFNRKYWNSRYITAPNHAGLYVERVQPDGGPEMFCLRQIARDSKQPTNGGTVFVPYIHTVRNVDGSGQFWHAREWAARQALRLFTAAYDTAGNRELYIWHNAHTVTDSRDTAGVVVFYADRYTKSADIDTDMQRNGNGVRLWTN